MLVDSNLLHELEQNGFSPTGEPRRTVAYICLGKTYFCA